MKHLSNSDDNQQLIYKNLQRVGTDTTDMTTGTKASFAAFTRFTRLEIFPMSVAEEKEGDRISRFADTILSISIEICNVDQII